LPSGLICGSRAASSLNKSAPVKVVTEPSPAWAKTGNGDNASAIASGNRIMLGGPPKPGQTTRGAPRGKPQPVRNPQ